MTAHAAHAKRERLAALFRFKADPETERLSTSTDGLSADDLHRLSELPITPPDEKDLALEQLWQRIHRG